MIPERETETFGVETPLASQRSAEPLAGGARDVFFVANPTAGAGRRKQLVAECVKLIEGAGFRGTVVDSPQELTELASDSLDSGRLRMVFACGGDGTFSAALNRLPAGVPLALLPMGTENLLARYTQHSASPRRVLELVEQGVVATLDAGRAANQLFSLVLSVGFDAQVIHRVHANRRGHITHLAYARPIAMAMARYHWPQIKATATRADGTVTTVTGSWAFAANLPSYAQQLPIVHQARGTDGLLDLCVFRKGSIVSGFWYFWHVLRKRHHHLPSVTTTRFTHLRLEAVDGSSIPYQVDGDPGGVLPVEVEVVPERLKVVVTRQVAAKLGFKLSNRVAIG